MWLGIWMARVWPEFTISASRNCPRLWSNMTRKSYETQKASPEKKKTKGSASWSTAWRIGILSPLLLKTFEREALELWRALSGLLRTLRKRQWEKPFNQRRGWRPMSRTRSQAWAVLAGWALGSICVEQATQTPQRMFRIRANGRGLANCLGTWAPAQL